VRGWEVLIIPAIAVVVWILATIFRGNEGQKAPPRRYPDRFGDVPPQRRPPQRVAQAPVEPRRFTPPRPQPKRPVMLEEVREVVPVQPARPKPPVVLQLAEPEQAPPRQPAPVDFKAPEAPSQPSAPGVKPVAVSPVLVQVRQLLRAPKSAAAALVLREILDAPRCRRPHS
jgi:hypothetical protein